MPAVHEGLLERELDARATLVRAGREDARHDQLPDRDERGELLHLDEVIGDVLETNEAIEGVR